EGPIASYRFDFGDGTVLGLQSGATATHTYAAGSWTASVQVTDAGGLSATASVAVSVSQSNPNLVGNPSFETNIDGWAPIGGATLARVLGGSAGSYSLLVAGPPVSTSPYGITDQPAWVPATPAAGFRYRVRASVRADLGTSVVSLRVRESLGGSVGAWLESSQLTLSPAWQSIEVDYPTRWAGSTLDLQIVGQPSFNQQAFRVDEVSITRLLTSSGPGDRQAVLSISPPSGDAPLVVTADASASIVPQGAVPSYRFDFGDGTVVGPQAAATVHHIYAAGRWMASVEMSDGSGSSCGFAQAVNVAPGANLVR